MINGSHLTAGMLHSRRIGRDRGGLGAAGRMVRALVILAGVFARQDACDALLVL